MKKIILTGALFLTMLNLKAQHIKKVDCNAQLQESLDWIENQLILFENILKWDLQNGNLDSAKFRHYYFDILPLKNDIRLIKKHYVATFHESVQPYQTHDYWDNSKTELCECDTKIVKK